MTHALKKLVKKFNPPVVEIIEPMLGDDRRVATGLKSGFHSSLSNSDLGGKIWIFYENQLNISIISVSNQMITLEVNILPLSHMITLSIVYGRCNKIQRRSLWNDLCSLSTSIQGLLEAGYVENCFTWCNNRDDNARVLARLDRVLMNSLWATSFPSFRVEHLPRNRSNHAPLRLHLSSPLLSKPKPFRFLRMWALHESFQSVILKAWAGDCAAEPFTNIYLKLKKTKQLLRVWNREQFGNIFQQIKKVEENLDILDNRIQDDHSEDLINQSLEIKQKLERLQLMEEIFWKQKARNSWLEEGDKNTAFFHASATEKIRRLAIQSITLEDGTSISNLDDIKSTTVDFFEGLFQGEEVSLLADFVHNLPRWLQQQDNNPSKVHL
ncbi:uncharacterized protein LOC131220277 [Magnolia sinica]|uniref:uncharacterized protein LOC131220277 n=1 Tax=Magnolia sinica TaxID=86752 RepID=UPI0026599D6C|nr:uncharacterized protein LOC131220277 [Magnolia sinica]